MNNVFKATLARMIDPLVLRHVPPDDDTAAAPLRPRPEPEIIALPEYHRGISNRNFVASFAQREALIALETEILLTVAESYAISYRARSVQPLIPWKPKPR